MDTRKTRTVLARLAGLERRFKHWRRTCKGSARIPDALWSAAARAANTHGVSRVATMLKVNYHALQKRVKQAATAAGGRPSAFGGPAGDAGVRFVELAPPASTCECTMELEDTAGAKMRVQLKGMGMPDLVAVSRSFWSRQP